VTKRGAAVSLFVFGTLALACQILAGIDRVDKEKAPGTATDGSSSGDVVTTPDPCEHVVPPPVPSQDDDRNSVPGFYLALRSASLVQANGTAAGFDLDGVCTCDKRPNTAFDGGPSCTPRFEKGCDEDGGIDNKGTTLFSRIAGGAVDINQASDIQQSIDDGKGGLLIYIEEYNGKANDREVYASAMRSYGIVNGSGCGTSEGGSPNKYKPGWCGHDKWSYSQELVAPRSNPIVPLGRTKGWVNNGTLVFQNDVSVTLFFGKSTLSFGSPVTAGKLFKNADGNWRFEAIMSGRVPVFELLRAAGTLNDPLGSQFPDGGRKPLCLSQLYPSVKKTLCDAVDIAKTNAFDFVPETACDAISSAVSFVAEQAELGDEHTEPATDRSCGPTTNNPLFDCNQ
jgi:hypothetical protein